MNTKFQKINIEEVLFFDAEIVRRNKELIVDSIEYELFQKKTRNRETDEYLTDKELQEEYNKKGALKRGFNKVVTIGVGFVKNDIPYIKEITGDEESIIKEFVSIVNQFSYCCSFNGIAFDLPIIVGNGMKYFNIASELRDCFNPSGKKVWNLDKCLDLMDIFKGTYYYNSSLEEVCYHFDIPSPKDDISGADVSRVYYEEGVDRISEYVKKDVLANINIFQKMRGEDIFKTFTDRGNIEVKKLPILERIYKENDLTPALQKELKEELKGKKLLKKDRQILTDIIHKVSLNDDFMNKDKESVIEDKLKLAEEFVNGL